MSFKKNAIAIACALGVPLSANAADVNIDFYGSLRIGVVSQDDSSSSDETTLDLVSRFSRIGLKASTELPNGLTAFGRYEWQIDAANQGNSNDDANGINDRIRHGIVGIKGDFGKIYLGQTYHTFYNFIVGDGDWPWFGSGFSSMVEFRGRTGESISYEGSYGDFSYGATLVLDGESTELDTSTPDPDDTRPDNEDIDETELGLAYNVGPVKLGAGYIGFGSDNTEDIYALSASGKAGPVTWATNYQIQEQASGEDKSSITANFIAYGFYAHIEAASEDDAPEPTLLTLGYNHKIGPNTSMWIEYTDFDADASSDEDLSYLEVIFKYDFD